MRRNLMVMAVLAGMVQGCIPDLRTVGATGAETGAVALQEGSTGDLSGDRLAPAMVDASEAASDAAAKARAVPKAETPSAEKAGATGDAVAPVLPEAPALPAVTKSREQERCEKRGDRWAKVGDSEARTCLRQTRDGGTSCSDKDQCDGQCLARSRTCAPFDPLLGCNDVLQDNGATVTLCID